jgi:hypothetical protein
MALPTIFANALWGVGGRRAASACKGRSHSPNTTNRPAGPPTPLAVLAPALEGFRPTPEMPEIAEAQALLERLA